MEALNIIKETLPESGKVYKPSAPFPAKVVENRRITSSSSGDDVRHIVLDIQGSGMQYLEGQSIGVLTPGVDATGKPHRVRLYSIASSRLGDLVETDSIGLTVKRVVYNDPESGREVRGVASNYMCDLEVGDSVNITGPIGRKFFLPVDSTIDLIMVAVGSGIAPFRAFIHRIYRDRGEWKGRVRLFSGFKTGMESLYMNDENNDIGQYYDEMTFRAFKALSDVDGVLVQNRIEENHGEVWQIIKDGRFMFYVCGVKGMEEGVDAVFSELARKEGRDWKEMKAAFIESGQWNVEVY